MSLTESFLFQGWTWAQTSWNPFDTPKQDKVFTFQKSGKTGQKKTLGIRGPGPQKRHPTRKAGRRPPPQRGPHRAQRATRETTRRRGRPSSPGPADSGGRDRGNRRRGAAPPAERPEEDGRRTRAGAQRAEHGQQATETRQHPQTKPDPTARQARPPAMKGAGPGVRVRRDRGAGRSKPDSIFACRTFHHGTQNARLF